MAYEILYARKVDLWDKIKEVKFSQFFPCASVLLIVLFDLTLKNSLLHLKITFLTYITQSECDMAVEKN
jgi:hypothetical protein